MVSNDLNSRERQSCVVDCFRSGLGRRICERPTRESHFWREADGQASTVLSPMSIVIAGP